MLRENDGQRIRIKHQKELERKRREYDKNKKDSRDLEKMKRDMEFAFLNSDKIGSIIIVDKGEYNRKMKDVIVKLGAESVEKDPNEVLMDKRLILIKNGEWPDNKGP